MKYKYYKQTNLKTNTYCIYIIDAGDRYRVIYYSDSDFPIGDGDWTHRRFNYENNDSYSRIEITREEAFLECL